MDEEPGRRPGPEGAEGGRRPAPAGYGAASARTPPEAASTPPGNQPGTDEPGHAGRTVYGPVTRFGPVEPGRAPGAGPTPPRPDGSWTAVAAAHPQAGGPGGPVPPWAGPAYPPPPGGPAPWAGGPPPWGGGMPPWPPPARRPSWTREQYAPWISRVGSDLVDRAPAYVASVLVLVSYVPLYTGLFRGDLDARPTWWLLVVGLLLSLASTGWNVYNRWYVAGRTGQSLGKRVTGTWLVSEVDGRPIGMLNAFLRDLLHVLDGSAYVGYLWPLWDERRQTFADKIIETVVVRTPVAPLSDDERARRR